MHARSNPDYEHVVLTFRPWLTVASDGELLALLELVARELRRRGYPVPLVQHEP